MSTPNIDGLARQLSPWVRAHEALSRLAKQRAQADAEEGRWLIAALRSTAHVHLGFATFGEYIERLFGYSRRFTQERLRVAEALEDLPSITRALEEGAVSWSAVRELTRVVVTHTERAWLEVAYGKTVRELEHLVAGKHRGDAPDAPIDPSARQHTLRFEVSAETLALFREAMSELRRRIGSAVSEDAALLEMARYILGATKDASRSTYQIALSVCPDCGRGTQQASGRMVPVDPHIVAMATCDAQRLGRIDVQAANGPQPANDARSAAASEGRMRTHVGPRAKQTIPPATRRNVLRRDHQTCCVPGCRNASFVDLHHIRPRSEGGDNRAENLITVCGAHHRALHRGELTMEGTVAANVRFRHSDGSPYGNIDKPRRLEIHTKLFSALRNLGFRESEVRAAMTHVSEDGALVNAPIEQWLRAALQRMTSSSVTDLPREQGIDERLAARR